jgi:hypothetical protein
MMPERLARAFAFPGALALRCIRESGGTGRRAGFRILWGNPWEFESPLSHIRVVALPPGSPETLFRGD